MNPWDDTLADWDYDLDDPYIDPDSTADEGEHPLDFSATSLCRSRHPAMAFITCHRVPDHGGRCGALIGRTLVEWMPE